MITIEQKREKISEKTNSLVRKGPQTDRTPKVVLSTIDGLHEQKGWKAGTTRKSHSDKVLKVY